MHPPPEGTGDTSPYGKWGKKSPHPLPGQLQAQLGSQGQRESCLYFLLSLKMCSGLSQLIAWSGREAPASSKPGTQLCGSENVYEVRANAPSTETFHGATRGHRVWGGGRALAGGWQPVPVGMWDGCVSQSRSTMMRFCVQNILSFQKDKYMRTMRNCLKAMNA